MAPRVVISDSSCRIDLRKASLLEAFLRLPYELLIPDTLFEDELLMVSAALQVLAKDPTVRLPQHELAAYLRRYASS